MTTPGTFEDVVELLIPELRRRGLYAEKIEDGLTAREKVYGRGQSKLRDDHSGSAYKYAVYKEDPPYSGKHQSTSTEADVEKDHRETTATTGAARLESNTVPRTVEMVSDEPWPQKTPLPRALFKQWPKR